MNRFSLRAWHCLAVLLLLAATASFAQPSLNGPMLRQTLQAMPKGGDLHNHLSGSIYAESYLRYAADDGTWRANAGLPNSRTKRGRLLALLTFKGSLLECRPGPRAAASDRIELTLPTPSRPCRISGRAAGVL